MKVSSGNQPSLQLINPLFLFQKLASGAMAVVTRVVSLLFEPAIGTRVNVSAQIAAAAIDNIIERFGLYTAQTQVGCNLFQAGI